MPKYKIADIVFETNHIYKYSAAVCKDYGYDGSEQPAFTANITQKDIDAEKEFGGDCNFPDYYLESLALFRKLCYYALNCADGIILHCSALAVDGKAYLFTAPSGTGKSTHARMWRERFGEKVVMVNDDKPIIRFVDGKFYVYGTPWNGKHKLGNNMRAEISAICELKRGEKNEIERLKPQEILLTLMRQTIRPTDEKEADKFFGLLQKLADSVKFYRLKCNISHEAAEIAYNEMSKGN